MLKQTFLLDFYLNNFEFKLLRMSCPKSQDWLSMKAELPEARASILRPGAFLKASQGLGPSRASCLRPRASFEVKLPKALGRLGLAALSQGPLLRLSCPRPWSVKD